MSCASDETGVKRWRHTFYQLPHEILYLLQQLHHFACAQSLVVSLARQQQHCAFVAGNNESLCAMSVKLPEMG
jgi:hypothetical protein